MCQFLAWLILPPWRCRRYVPLAQHLTFNDYTALCLKRQNSNHRCKNLKSYRISPIVIPQLCGLWYWHRQFLHLGSPCSSSSAPHDGKKKPERPAVLNILQDDLNPLQMYYVSSTNVLCSQCILIQTARYFLQFNANKGKQFPVLHTTFMCWLLAGLLPSHFLMLIVQVLLCSVLHCIKFYQKNKTRKFITDQVIR
jgi:hypothetical protein